jgi:adhesin transport system outer membrane protein
VVAAALSAASVAHAQSLSESVSLAVTTNPKVETIIHNREGVDSELRRARGLYLPQIDLHSSIGPEYTDNILTVGTNGQHMRTEFEAVLTQKLYDGGATTAEVDRQKARSKSAAYRIRENADSVGLDAVEAHLDIVRLRKILAFADENVRVHRGLLDRVQQRSSSGAGRGADVAQAATRLEQAEAARDETRGLLQDAEARYLIVVGRPAGTLEEAVLPPGMLPASVDDSILALQKSNPIVKAREADIDAAEAGVDAADAKFDPVITFEVGGMHDHNVDGFPGRDDEARALVVLHWNLYAGGSDIANRESAYAQVEQAKTTRLEALRQAELDVRQAWSAYESAMRRLPPLKASAEHNVDVRNAYDQQFQVSQRTLLDLLDSQNELFQSQTRLITDQEQVVFNGFRILAVQGTLLQALNVQPPPEADYTQKTKRPQRPKKESF